jgi:hypothetical protein
MEKVKKSSDEDRSGLRKGSISNTPAVHRLNRVQKRARTNYDPECVLGCVRQKTGRRLGKGIRQCFIVCGRSSVAHFNGAFPLMSQRVEKPNPNDYPPP